MTLKQMLRDSILVGATAVSLNTSANETAPTKIELQSAQDPYAFFNHANDETSQWYYQVPLNKGFQNTPLPQIDEAVLKAPHLDDIKNGWGQTLLTAAVMNGKTELANILLENGANPNKKNALNQSPLTLAVMAAHRNPGAKAILPVLIEKGANVNETDEKGRSLLMLAAQYGDKEVIKALLNGGADKNATDKDGKTALNFYQNRIHLTTGKNLDMDKEVLTMVEPQKNLTKTIALNALDKWLSKQSAYTAKGPLMDCGEETKKENLSMAALAALTSTRGG